MWNHQSIEQWPKDWKERGKLVENRDMAAASRDQIELKIDHAAKKH